ncbi:hypothetical protein NLI96_g5467 [Meripilus lineatus]|uniref:Uncharacterized protein n=1 Tax=Meripilus lineatus TaxID=2056292 RepID=A0AAD5V516_9APHY|nr:hypothetical protein NLI96_g5467 [Physisporinus lineatus]
MFSFLRHISPFTASHKSAKSPAANSVPVPAPAPAPTINPPSTLTYKSDCFPAPTARTNVARRPHLPKIDEQYSIANTIDPEIFAKYQAVREIKWRLPPISLTKLGYRKTSTGRYVRPRDLLSYWQRPVKPPLTSRLMFWKKGLQPKSPRVGVWA